MLSTLTTGLLVGLAAGISPGPLLMLVLSVSLRSGIKEGMKVALSPALTDLPIIAVTLLLVHGLEKATWSLGLLSMAGAGYIGWLAWESINVKPLAEANTRPPLHALKQGVLVNLLNPHPYLFWFSVGTPLIAKLWTRSPWLSLVWITGFYTMLLGSKMVLAVLFGRSRNLFSRSGFIWVHRVLGLVLFLFAAMLLREGLVLIKVW